jgi:uncharacterized protein YjeT (DUF2065 family)
MDMAVKIIGILIVALAIVLLVKPAVTKSLIGFFSKGKRLYLAGLARLVLGVIFLLAARECDITWLIAAFGVLFLIAGLLIFTLGPEKLRGILTWSQKQSSLLLRAFAVIALAIGAVIIYAA